MHAIMQKWCLMSGDVPNVVGNVRVRATESEMLNNDRWDDVWLVDMVQGKVEYCQCQMMSLQLDWEWERWPWWMMVVIAL